MIAFLETVKAESIARAKACLDMARSETHPLTGGHRRRWVRNAAKHRLLALEAHDLLKADLVMSKRQVIDELMDERDYLQVRTDEADLHIDILHALIKSGDLDTAKKMAMDWEVDQCPF